MHCMIYWLSLIEVGILLGGFQLSGEPESKTFDVSSNDDKVETLFRGFCQCSIIHQNPSLLAVRFCGADDLVNGCFVRWLVPSRGNISEGTQRQIVWPDEDNI